MRYFSMFTGVGGFELGIQRAFQQIQMSSERQEKIRSSGDGCVQDKWSDGYSGQSSETNCVGFSEIDKFSCELLANKFPDVKNYGDATKIVPEGLPDFDLLVGGFPCQAFSIAGKRKGFEDTRGTLFYDIARILKVKRPKYILLENVKGLLSHDSGRTFGTILTTLSELGYVIQWMVLNSKFFGVPQNRERVFIIGSLRGERLPEVLPLGKECQEIDELQGQQTNTLKARYTAIGDGSYIIKSKQYAQVHSLYPRSGNPKQGGTGHLTKNDETSYCLDTGNMQGLEMDNMKIRRLTPLECERLQGFPDGWTEGFSDTQRYKMMGNAVTVNVIQAIIQRMFMKEGER